MPTWPGLAPGDLLRRRSRAPLPFPFNARSPRFYYRARNALYHLFRALRRDDSDSVLVPDYHHGNEVSAIRAAGFGVRFYPVRRDLSVDLDALARLLRDRPRAVLLIHYLGWPQPLDEILALCRKLEIVSVEDCALSLLSEDDGVSLGARADFAVFCLYKTLPVPNGGLLVRRQGAPEVLAASASAPCGVTSLVARTLDLTLERIRGRSDYVGAPLVALKSQMGRVLTRAAVRRWPVGESGFDQSGVDLRMSALSQHLLDRFDYGRVRARRRDNFEQLMTLLAGRATPLHVDLKQGVCPLFFPLLVPNKAEAARALWARGIGAVEFWNRGDPEAHGTGRTDAAFLREHVLELPIHQDVRPEQLAYMADEVGRLDLRMKA